LTWAWSNIAVDSDGIVHTGRQVNHVRYRHRLLRAKLQAKGTRSAKRKLKRLSGKERRFAKDTNHCISKKLVAKRKTQIERLPWKISRAFVRGLRFVALSGQSYIVRRSSSFVPS